MLWPRGLFVYPGPWTKMIFRQFLFFVQQTSIETHIQIYVKKLLSQTVLVKII